MADLENRAAGVLVGLAAGDRIGGPLRMALRVAESLVDRGGLDVSDIGARYLAWWREGAFDTGPTAARALALAASGVPFEAAAAQADKMADGLTAGCNPAHRNAPLAMCAAIDDSTLATAAASEARLTHRHPLAGDVAAAVAGLCRALIRGTPWTAALSIAADGRRPETCQSLRTSLLADLSPTGYAPEALGAAIYFVSTSASFSIALARSLDFAGPANYCPVLVGSIGGARWGHMQIDKTSLEHGRDLVSRVKIAAFALARGWKSSGVDDN